MIVKSSQFMRTQMSMPVLALLCGVILILAVPLGVLNAVPSFNFEFGTFDNPILAWLFDLLNRGLNLITSIPRFLWIGFWVLPFLLLISRFFLGAADWEAQRAWSIFLPLNWLLIFFALPFVFVFVISFSQPEIAIPPYQPVIFWEERVLRVQANFENYIRLFTDTRYVNTYLASIWTAFVSTVFALLIGFPMAYTIARAPEKYRNLLLILVIIPFWTSFLLRVYALIGLMQNTGQINSFLMWIGLIDQPIPMLKTDFAVYVGIVYTYLPFMILPLYANLVKLQDEVLEASSDLGASPFWTFWQVVVPLALPGIVAGSMLVFIPAIGEFVIPELLGGPETKMIGKQLWIEFFGNRDWGMASALAIVMLVLVVVPFMWLQRWQTRLEEATS